MKLCPTGNNLKLKQIQLNGFDDSLWLLIPAFTHNKQGLIIQIAVFIKESQRLEITGEGHIARSLEKIFKRNIEILSTLKESYKMLTRFQFKLVSTEQGFRVRDVRSASLGICITLLNVLRIMSGKRPNQTIVGTGLLRTDGSFSASSLESIKEQAVQQKNNHLEFTNSNHCNHVFELEALLGNVPINACST